jgi:deoxyribonuclease-4
MSIVYNVNWDIGAHTPFSGKISDTLFYSLTSGMYATQFFMGSPYSFKRRPISESDIKTCQNILERYPMKVFSHFPYVANLAGSVKSLAWNGDERQDKKTLALLEGLGYELNTLGKIGGGVVIHPGNFPDKKKGISAISKTINKLHFSEDENLLLENASGEGNDLATTFFEIRDIIQGVDRDKRKYVNVCIDTCHLFAYGEYDLTQIGEVDRIFSEFDKVIGLDKLHLIHLNDSQTPRSGKTDRHELIGQGHIWKKDLKPLVYMLNFLQEKSKPCVLETHESDMFVLSNLK